MKSFQRSIVRALGVALALAFALAPAVPAARPQRPVVRGMHGIVSSGNPLVSGVAIDVLQRGGNAADAGVAALFAAMVVEHTHHSLGGESAILYWDNTKKKAYAINGVGPAPQLATWEFFHDLGYIPNQDSFLIAPVPGTLDGAVLTLDRFGTRTLTESMLPAIRFAEYGHPIDEIVVKWIETSKTILQKWPGSVAAFMPGGQVPKPGDVWVQPVYASTLKKIAAGELKNLWRGRSRSMEAARDVFYKGEIARALDQFSRENGGLVRYEDLAAYHARVEEPLSTTYGEYQVFSVGTWTQGPMLLEVLNMLESKNLGALPQNSPQYIHYVIEAFKLAYADRHAYYADPYSVPVPQKGIVSKAYGAERGALIDPAVAAMDVPPGWPWVYEPRASLPTRPEALLASNGVAKEARDQIDTTALVVIDKDGNMFATTSSNNMGVQRSGVTAPALGFVLSGRLRQFSLDPNNPNVVAGGKIPRITPAPSMALKNGQPYIAWTTPGEDVQMQANLQVLFNIIHFGMDPQTAVEVPRFRSLHGPDAAYPQAMLPGQMRIEPRITADVMSALAAMGHKVQTEPDWAESSGGMVVVTRDPATGVLQAGADPRRSCYALGW
jgi:gamma-glutamyltranspeptidase/glutathione hydrolase